MYIPMQQIVKNVKKFALHFIFFYIYFYISTKNLKITFSVF